MQGRRAGRSALVAAMVVAALPALGNEPRGLWLTARKDPSNQARADVPGRMREAPEEVWRLPTGGEVQLARGVSVGGQDAVLLQVGSNLEVSRWDGQRLWRDAKLGAGRVLRLDDFDGDGQQEVLVCTDARTVVLLDVPTGRRLWSWQCEPSTQISGNAFYRTPTGLRFIAFPSYSLNGYCFDFSGSRERPKLLWQQHYGSLYGAGYGPSIVLKEMAGDAKPDIVLSGKVPSVAQAIIDIDTGAVKTEAHYDVQGWGRPYGLLHATDLDGDGRPDLVMVCCQVEEYLAVARSVGGRIEKLWGHFIEKDWPTDEKELRPQVTSVADLRGTGRAELVVGHWDGRQWHTLVIDPLKGFTAQRGSLPGTYFWGCHDLTGDGRREVIVSTEAKRRPAQVSTLLALDGSTLQPVARLEQAAVFASADSPTPDDVAFMALRRNPVFLKLPDGTGGILVRTFRGGKEAGISLWGGRPGQPVGLRRVAGPGFQRVHVQGNRAILADASGRLQRLGADLRPVGKPLAAHGRLAAPLVWEAGGRRELVVGTAGGVILGGVPDLARGTGLRGAWRVPGTAPALHLDAAGRGRLCAIDPSSSDHPTALIYEDPLGPRSRAVRVALPHRSYLGLLPHGGEFRLLVPLQTGVHTLALACADAQGRILWQDPGSGAHPKMPGAADLDGDGRPEVIADDHGVMKLYGPTGTVLGTDSGWPPAYTLPIIGPFGPEGATAILRTGGYLGISLVDAKAKPLWKVGGPIWRYYKSLPAVGQVGGAGQWAMGALAEDGTFECLETATGKLRWSVPLGAPPEGTPVAAGDLDGNGRDEFLLGLADGRLLCLAEEAGQGRILWQKELDAAVGQPIIADVDGDGFAEVIVSTSDGCVRILRESEVAHVAPGSGGLRIGRHGGRRH